MQSAGVRLMWTAVTVCAGFSALIAAGQNRIDVVTPWAPELAAFGPHPIGVRTMTIVDRDRADVLNTREGAAIARYDRPLTLEIWYPAVLAPGQQSRGEYQVVTRDPNIRATLTGQAVRDAAPESGMAFPLVIVSHGYPGSRFLLSHLGENLASKGYVVVSIDHTDSTYTDQKPFASTLYNRPLDQQFVLSEIDRLSRSTDPATFLRGLVDARRTGIIGYSMGGYGVVNLIGGGFSAASDTFSGAPPNHLLAERGAANPAYRETVDRRIRAAVAIGPWGMQLGFWDAQGLTAIRAPVLFVAGSVDDVSGYEKGTRALFEGVVNADRYLLTFLGANHNAAAPHPAPVEVLGADSPSLAYAHYADPVWDTTRMNNILQHFVSAYFDRYLKDDSAKAAYFDVIPNGKDAVHAIGGDGTPLPTHTYWKGFKRGTAVGLVLEHRRPGE
jgi:predicted dienelactone hydrolase